MVQNTEAIDAAAIAQLDSEYPDQPDRARHPDRDKPLRERIQIMLEKA